MSQSLAEAPRVPSTKRPFIFTYRSPRGQLDSKMLLEAGILRDPRHPDQALERARTLARHGRVREARNLIHPHMRRACGLQRARMAELLGKCSMAGAGGNWHDLLHEALRGYSEAEHLRGVARTQRTLGEMLLSSGRLAEATAMLQQAVETYQRQGSDEGVARSRVLKARVLRRAGRLDEALAEADGAVAMLDALGRAGSASLARLERARLRSMRGDQAGAAHDLVDADQLLSANGDATSRLRARLMRAEILMRQGEKDRVAAAMRRVVSELSEVEDAHVRAWSHYLMGESLTTSDPQQARRQLTRARHLYEALGHVYNVVSCDLLLARIEHELGLDTRPRLATFQRQSLAEWPLLRAELAVLRATLGLESNAQKLIDELREARRFALESGDRALAREVTRALRRQTALPHDNEDTLTPVELPPRAATTHAALFRALATGADGQRLAPHPLERIDATGASAGVGRPRPVFASLLASSAAGSPVRANLRRPITLDAAGSNTASRVA